MDLLTDLASRLTLGDLLERVRSACGPYSLVDHWQQGEFHHDVVIRVSDPSALPGPVLVVATNCNGGVKEVLCFPDVPDRSALWHHRCPANPEFSGGPVTLLGSAVTVHWFDPCELLLPDARSELQEQHRERQCGGGWQQRG